VVTATNNTVHFFSPATDGEMPLWHNPVKRMLDIGVAATGLLLLTPMLLYVACRVYFSSPGPVLYIQERVGRKGRKFYIFKFRSMYVNAEDAGPRLSGLDDERITPWGRKMRKWKLDELPQLWNVLKGEMSIVGPRPERAYYINQLGEDRQRFEHLLSVKPGLTSLGMIRFGYAATLAEMRERMKYDLLYLQKKSLALDIKIMLSTVRVVLAARNR